MVAMLSGIKQFVDGKLDEFPLPAGTRRFPADELLRDRDGGLWIGTRQTAALCIFIRAERMSFDDPTDSPAISSRKSLRIVKAPFGWPRWMASTAFATLAVSTSSVRQGLSNATVESVLAARDGGVWLGTTDGLNRWKDGHITFIEREAVDCRMMRFSLCFRTLRTGFGCPRGAVSRSWKMAGLLPSPPYREKYIPSPATASGIFGSAKRTAFSICAREGLSNGSLWTKLGHADGVRTLVADPLGGGLWLAFRDGGVAYFKDGQVRVSYDGADGLGEGHVRDLQLDREGTLWASTEGGLSRVKDSALPRLPARTDCLAMPFIG